MNGETDEQLQRKARRRRGLTFIILAIALAGNVYLISKTPQIVFRMNERTVVYKHAENSAIFNLAASIAAFAAILFLLSGICVLLARPQEPSPIATTAPHRSSRLVWKIVNTAILLLSTWSGYAALSPAKLKGTNPDLVLCIAAFIGIAMFAIAAPHFATVATFRKPQWGRFFLSWWRDPMQTLFMTTCFWAAWVVGSAARFFSPDLRADKTAMWTVLTYAAILAGLVIGQVIAYPVYRNRIESAAQ